MPKTVSVSVPGATLLAWMQYLETSRGREFVERVMEGLSPKAKEAFSPKISRARMYAEGPFDEFCRAVERACGGLRAGLGMGQSSARQNARVLEPILRSAKGDVLYFLSERLNSVHRLYAAEGTWRFEPSAPGEGALLCRGFTHNALSCWSNAGYVSECLVMMGGASRVEVRAVEHAPAPDAPCRIVMRWKKA